MISCLKTVMRACRMEIDRVVHLCPFLAPRHAGWSECCTLACVLEESKSRCCVVAVHPSKVAVVPESSPSHKMTAQSKNMQKITVHERSSGHCRRLAAMKEHAETNEKSVKYFVCMCLSVLQLCDTFCHEPTAKAPTILCVYCKQLVFPVHCVRIV